MKEFWKVQDPPRQIDAQAMRDRVSEALTDECWRMLDDGVVGAPEEIDICMIFGAGYPFTWAALPATSTTLAIPRRRRERSSTPTPRERKDRSGPLTGGRFLHTMR